METIAVLIIVFLVIYSFINRHSHNDNDSNENYDKHEFYGGISVGNDSVYMTDDDDFLDEFGDDIL